MPQHGWPLSRKECDREGEGLQQPKYLLQERGKHEHSEPGKRWSTPAIARRGRESQAWTPVPR